MKQFTKSGIALLTVLALMLGALTGCVPAAQTSAEPTPEQTAAPAEAPAAAATYTPGSYTATAKGFGGDVTVTVTVDEDAILTVEAVGDSETAGIGSNAIEQLPAKIVEAQSAEVDAISGCTFSSTAVKTAAAAAIEEARVVKSAAAPAAMVPGTYESTVKGYLHDIEVAVTVDETSITNVETLYSYESENVGEYAVSVIAPRILEAQSFNVDVVTGATVTSNAYMLAVRNALEQAGADLSVFGADKTTEAPINCIGNAADFDADIIVIGAGVAGLTAALTAVDEGAKVLVIEQQPYTGGSSRFAHGSTLCVGADIQLEQYPDDSAEKMYEDLVEYAKGDDRFIPELAKAYCEAQGPALNKLMGWGVQYTLATSEGPHTSWCEEMRYAEPISGYDAIETLTARMQCLTEEGRMAYLLNTRAEELIQDAASGAITGVRVVDTRNGETASYSAPATILAFGGYSNNQEMLLKYHYSRVGCSSGESSTGTGFAMAEAVGAYFTGAGFTRCDGGMIPNEDPNDNIVRYEVLYKNAGLVWLNKDGVRIENEGTSNGYERMAAWYYAEDNTVYILFNQGIVDKLAEDGKTILTIGNYSCYAYDTDNEMLAELVNVHPCVHRADTIEEVAQLAGLDPAAVAETLSTYNGYCAAGVDEDFGKSASKLIAMEEGPYYLIETIPSAKSTFAGLMVDPEARIVTESGDVIPGLYGCGELIGSSKVVGRDHVTGTFWGLGTSFGFLAGTNAAAEVRNAAEAPAA